MKRHKIISYVIPVLLLLAASIVGALTFRMATQADDVEILNTPNDSGGVVAVVCRVNADRILGPVNRGIFGTNLEWFNNANGLWKSDGKMDSSLVALAKEQGISSVRFPGGTFSDFYHWQDGIGLQSERPVRPHMTDPGHSANVFGTPELFRFCKAIGASPLLTVNVGSGSPEEAAQWLEYCNTPDNPLRQADGFDASMNVQYWEIGNELYLAGTEAEKKITLTPEGYAQRFLDYAKAMRKIDPSISLLALGVADSYRVPFGPYPNWTETVLQSAASEIDAIAVHNAYFPCLVGPYDLPPKEIYRALWAAPESVDQSLYRLEALIAKYEKQREINIAVTEWGPFFSINDPQWIDHVKTLGAAVYVARLLQVFMEHPRVTLANYFKFTDQTFMGWVSYRGEPKIPYYALKIYARHFGSQRIESSINSRTFNTRDVGLTPAQQGVPELTVVSSLDEEGRSLYINIVNRGWTTAYEVTMDILGFSTRFTAGKVITLRGDSPMMHNGPDLPEWWPLPRIEPAPTAKAPGGIETLEWDRNAPFVIPPHSITTFELKKDEKDD